MYWEGGFNNTRFGKVSGSSIFVFVGKEWKSDQAFIIHLEELPGVVLVHVHGKLTGGVWVHQLQN